MHSCALFNDIDFLKVVPPNFYTVPTALRENAKVNKLFPSALLEKLDFHFLCWLSGKGLCLQNWFWPGLISGRQVLKMIADGVELAPGAVEPLGQWANWPT